MEKISPALVKKLKRIRLVATDLDGTLLNDEGKISERTRQKVRELKELGMRLAIMTARAHSSAERISDELEFEAPIISLDGGLVRLPHTKENIYASYIKPKIVAKVLASAEERLAAVALFVDDKMMRREFETMLPSYIDNLELDTVVVDDLRPYSNRTIQIIAGAESSRAIKNIARAAGGLFSGVESKIYRSAHYDDRWYLEVKNKNHSKATGLVHLERFLGVGKDAVAVLGDFRNDIAAFDRAAIGVAMRNAVWELKEKADLITDGTNDQDGAAEFFEDLIRLGNHQ